MFEKNKKYLKTKILCLKIFCFIIFLFVFELNAFQIQYNINPNFIYTYEVKCLINPVITIFGNKFDAYKEIKAQVDVRVIQAEDGFYLLEITEGDNILRRILRRDGTITYSTSEDLAKLPFFITFPNSQLTIGKGYKISKEIVNNFEKVNIEWQIIPNKLLSNSVIFIIVGGARFPESKVYNRDIKVKGEAKFNQNYGLFESGKWQIIYNFELHNKEVAVIRNLWNYSENWEISFNLKEVKNVY